MSLTTRQALLDAAKSLNRYVKPGSAWDRATPSDRPGDLFNRSASWSEILGSAGWVMVSENGGVQYWKRPGSSEHKWSATVGYLRQGAIPLLFVFSSSAAPFELEKTYTPFAAYTLLNHNGDFNASAKELVRQGFTTRPGSGSTPKQESEPAKPKEEPQDDIFPDTVPWPEPISELAYYGLAGKIVKLIEPETEADPVAILIQILVMFGNAIGRNAYWQVEGDRHYGNLFCCLVGETAKGRKGTSKGRALQAFAEIDDPHWRSSAIVSGLSSGEGLIWAVRDPVYKTHLVKKAGRVVDTQMVKEDNGIPDKRLLVVESEFARALRSAGREGNTLSPLVRESWDTGNLYSLTKNNQAKATGAHISIIGHITKAELAAAMSEVEATNGFANRFLWCAVRRSKLLPMGGNPVDLSIPGKQLAELVDAAKVSGEVSFDEEAEQLWCQEIYPRLTAPAHGISASICNRAEAQVRRLALLYSLLDNRSLVARPEHLLAALAVLDYCEQSVKWIFGDTSGDRVADEIKSALQNAGDRGMTQTEISNIFGRNESKAKLAQALALLEEGGSARKEKTTPATGRPTVKWFIVTK